jgi:rod shape-determining protein MreC
LLLPGTWAKSEISKHWNHYIALIDIAEENACLREEKNTTDQHLASVQDDLAELARLRALIGLKPPAKWRTLGSRVLAGRFGPGASLETAMIDRGFATGAPPGTPIVTPQGLVGRVFRASPHISTVLLLTDQTFRAAVVTSEGRVPGIIMGGGPRASLEVKYMAPNLKVEVGELLITSGLDDTFPKGLPVARVTRVEPGAETLFQQVHAEPLASPNSLEEVLLLISPENWPAQVAMPDIVPSAPAGRQAGDEADNAFVGPQPAGAENAR